MVLRLYPRFRAVRWIGLILVGLFLAACNSSLPSQPVATETPLPLIVTPTPESAWGAISRLAEAPIFNAPALTTTSTGVMTATFVRRGNVWQLQLFENDQAINTAIIAASPYGLTLHADTRGGFFAVWMDYRDGRGGWLSVARLDKQGQSELGSILITETQAVHYSAAPTPEGRLWVVWSAAPIPESVVMVSRVDEFGRPRAAGHLVSNADYPVLLRADGRTWLFWLSADDGILHRAELTDSQTLENPALLNRGIGAKQGQVFTGLSVGVDTENAYVFWQTQTDGIGQVWWASGKLTADSWETPQTLEITFDPSQTGLQAGYNHGILTAVHLGETEVTWLQPAYGQSDNLATAITTRDNLGVLYWRDGLPFAGQNLIATPRLIAPPSIGYDTERDIAVAWWEILSETTAQLSVIYSRR